MAKITKTVSQQIVNLLGKDCSCIYKGNYCWEFYMPKYDNLALDKVAELYYIQSKFTVYITSKDIGEKLNELPDEVTILLAPCFMNGK